MPAPMPQMPMSDEARVDRTSCRTATFGGFDQPRNRRRWLNQPSAPSIWFQTSTPATNGTTYGRKKQVRMALEPNTYLLLSPSGDGERDDDRDGQPDRREAERVRQRLPDLGVAEQAGVVVEPDEAERLFLGQRQVQEGEDRSVASIGKAVKARKPMIQGEMKR